MDNFWFLLIAAVLGFIISAIAGKFFVPFWENAGAKQNVSRFGIESHQVKTGTPTFGGSIFLTAFTLLTVIYLFIDFSPMVLAILLFVLAHAAIGFIDDYFNIRVNNFGLEVKQKAALLFIVELAFVIYYLYGTGQPITIVWPFGLEATVIQGAWKILYGAFLLFYFMACTNATNIVDGVDGLSSSVTVVTLAFSGITAFVLYKNVTATSSNFGLAVISFVMLGALLGFLIYNWHPAKIFMGDMGSLALGALTSTIFLAMGMPWVFIFAGIIYVIDIATVLIQRSYYKISGGKRIFRYTPIHHQFELDGWSEVKIVRNFSLVQLIGSIVAGILVWTIAY